MSLNVRIDRKIIVNGKEYHSIDELPPEVRAAYEKAMASNLKRITVRRVTLNGRDFDSMDAVPEDVRALVGDAMGAQKRSSNATLVAVVAAVLLLVALALLRFR